MNAIPDKTWVGAVGELLVTLRLLQFGVQAVPPMKDTGNDLIAVKGRAFRAIQVKTTQSNLFKLGPLPKLYHMVALVHLVADGKCLYLDQSQIFLLERNQIDRATYWIRDLREYALSQDLVDRLFHPEEDAAMVLASLC